MNRKIYFYHFYKNKPENQYHIWHCMGISRKQKSKNNKTYKWYRIKITTQIYKFQCLNSYFEFRSNKWETKTYKYVDAYLCNKKCVVYRNLLIRCDRKCLVICVCEHIISNYFVYVMWNEYMMRIVKETKKREKKTHSQ